MAGNIWREGQDAFQRRRGVTSRAPASITAPMELHGENLTLERGGRAVLRGVSFSVRAGELLQITGPNGSGKSSLLRLIAGLNEASAGALRLEGGHGELAIGQQAHLIAHQEAVKAALTVAENLTFWSGFLGGGDVDGALAAFDLKRLSAYPAGLLSAGQKRRLALARLVLVPRAIWPATRSPRRSGRSGFSTSRPWASTRPPRQASPPS